MELNSLEKASIIAFSMGEDVLEYRLPSEEDDTGKERCKEIAGSKVSVFRERVYNEEVVNGEGELVGRPTSLMAEEGKEEILKSLVLIAGRYSFQ